MTRVYSGRIATALTPALHIIWFPQARADIRSCNGPCSVLAGGIKLTMGCISSSSFSSVALAVDSPGVGLEELGLPSDWRKDIPCGEDMRGKGREYNVSPWVRVIYRRGASAIE